MRLRIGEYFRDYRLSVMRWLVVGSIVASVFLADYFLKKDISAQVSEAWNEACVTQLAASVCFARIESHHKKCFDPAYSSMLMRFGKSRLEALKIMQYEQCMSDSFNPQHSADTKAKFSINEGLER
ncbi:MAG: hypothetical protein ACU84Q_07310 [Gammaproteobacteria bacterium]